MLRSRLSLSLLALTILSAAPARARADDGEPPPLPGGPFTHGANPPPCDAAHDHCLRPQARFLVDSLDAIRKHNDDATVVFAARGAWWDWGVARDRTTHTGDVVRTAPATAAKIKPGDIVLVWNLGPMRGDDPGSETDVHTRAWGAVVVKSVDAGAGTLSTEKHVWPIRNARVIVAVETQP